MATTSASNRQNPPNDEGSGDHKKTDEDADKGQMFDCNICLDTAKDAVISMCGHLFCWPCLHQWLETCPNRQTCPVCKAAIDKDKVIPVYGRGGSSKTDPRDKVPPRPQGQRTEPDTNGRDMDYSDYDNETDGDDLDDSDQDDDDDDGGQSTTWDEHTVDESTDEMTAATDDLEHGEFSTDDDDGVSIEEGVEAEEEYQDDYQDAGAGSEEDEIDVDIGEEMYSDEESEEDEYEEDVEEEEEDSYDDSDSS